jgi:hypothetical protein
VNTLQQTLTPHVLLEVFAHCVCHRYEH